ncbi:MAG: M67 family metallopeptidase [Actinobacteria bacterium]|nr:M67 family metallopeptidase [Actinomycetota bacterium]
MKALKEVLIDKHRFARLLTHCAKSVPKEACGILAGWAGRVELVIPVTNISEEPERRYRLNEAEQFEAFKRMRREGVELVGIYHSHPATEAYPSATDVELAFYPEAAYLIVSLRDGGVDTQAFRIVDGEIKKIELVVE